MGAAVGLDVLGFALLPAVLWGVSPILTKRGMDHGGSSLRAAVVVVSFGTATYWLSLFALTDPIESLGSLAPSTVFVFFLSGLTGAVVWFAYVVGVDRVGASVSSAGFNTHPLFATVLALVWLDEALGPLTVAGIVVLMAGLVVIALSEGGDIGGWHVWELAFPLAASAGYAVSNVIRRFGLTTTPATTHEAVTINSTTTLLVLGAYLLYDGRESLRAPSRAVDGYFAVSGLLSAAALFFLFEAFDRGSVAVVSAVSGTSPLFAVGFTYLLLSDLEAVTARIVAGALLVVVGAVLITVV